MKSPKDPGTQPPPAPPSPSELPPNVDSKQLKSEHGPEVTKKILKPKRVPMTRRGAGSKGQRLSLLANHFKVNISGASGYFYQYSVALFYEDGRPVETKGIGRRILDKVHETFNTDFAGKEFAYDGENSLFTIGALPNNKMEYPVLLDNLSSSNRSSCNDSIGDNGSPNASDKKRRRVSQSKTFKVVISYAAKIPMVAISAALRGQETESSQEAFRVLDIILRQHAAKQGCLLVRQSFFHNDPRNFTDLGGGILGCRGFHTSFRATQGGLSLNVDGTTTTIIQPGPLIDFLIAHQNVRDPYQLDWAKVKRTLKNLRIIVGPSKQEYRITRVSDNICKEQMFSLKTRPKDGNGDFITVNITVYDYFAQYHDIHLRYSGDFPCVNVGKPKRPTYIPIELCSLLPLQRYMKALTVFQRSSLVEKSRQKPQEKKNILSDVLKSNKYDSEPMLRSCGMSINTHFTQVEGRILSAPSVLIEGRKWGGCHS